MANTLYDWSHDRPRYKHQVARGVAGVPTPIRSEDEDDGDQTYSAVTAGATIEGRQTPVRRRQRSFVKSSMPRKNLASVGRRRGEVISADAF